MTCAYDKIYLEKARTALGRMLDVGVNDYGFSLRDFYDLFLGSPVSERFESGDYEVLVGHSGAELAYMVMDSVYFPYDRKAVTYTTERSPEYWLGWALAYYQWRTSFRFEELDRVIPIENLFAMYDPYHEMDIRHFCDAVDQLYRKAVPDTNLKRLRKRAGMSQSQLADAANVSVRTLQQYEQRLKNINKAATETVFQLSRILGCSVETLLEKLD